MTNLVEVLRQAFALPVVAERGIGCGRIYVSIIGKQEAAAVGKAAKSLNLIWQKRGHYGTSNVLYIGYDNCDGRSLARGTAVVAALKAAGVNCYRDEHAD